MTEKLTADKASKLLAALFEKFGAAGLQFALIGTIHHPEEVSKDGSVMRAVALLNGFRNTLGPMLTMSIDSVLKDSPGGENLFKPAMLMALAHGDDVIAVSDETLRTIAGAPKATTH